MKALTAALTTVALLCAGPAMADAALAKKNNCMVCHSVDKKMMGPSFNEIAAKHKGDQAAEAKLVNAIKNGSKGVYGAVPMPAQPNATADASALAKWILTL
ncbi:c-type cytochrome [Betaproteobacteria bacterium SCN2]|jgi:cytochrome c|nr:c-type cytochrome [Betaproteobacteria bacterium SCN2]